MFHWMYGIVFYEFLGGWDIFNDTFSLTSVLGSYF